MKKDKVQQVQEVHPPATKYFIRGYQPILKRGSDGKPLPIKPPPNSRKSTKDNKTVE